MQITTQFLTGAEWNAIAVHLELTPRERGLLREAVLGVSEDGIAKELGISRNTVHAHMTRMYRKVGARDRAQLVLCVFRAYVEIAKGT